MATRRGRVYAAEPDRPTETDSDTGIASVESHSQAVDEKLDLSTSSSSKDSTLKTRAKTDFWLIGHSSPSIAGARLPTNRQVMKVFLHLRHDTENMRSKITKEEIGYSVADEVSVFWQMARIKTKTRQNCMLAVVSLWREWDNLAKNKNRDSDPGGRRAAYVSNLDKLFDIGAPDAFDAIQKSRLLSDDKKKEDVEFYLDQRGERKASMLGHDKIFETKVEAQQLRQKRLKNFEEEEIKRVSEKTLWDITECEDVEKEHSESEMDTDTEYVPTVPSCADSAKQNRNEFITLCFPRKIMECEAITSAADRLKLSDNQTTMMVAAVIKAGKGDLNAFDISRQTTRRSRIANRQKIAEEVIDSIKENPPRFAALHWDGKLISDPLGVAGERLAVLVSGAPQYNEGKLLGIPTLADSTGQAQADASYDLLEVWDIVPSVVALVFDTTASNSGIKRGAAKLLESKIGKKLLYLACRHHILELSVGAVWKLLFGKVIGPDNKMFGAFKNAWNDIEKSLQHVETLRFENPWLLQIKKRVIGELTMLLEGDGAKSLPRDDYRECAENVLIILGQTPPRGVHFLKPGAIHQARWMACNLYASKMFMFAKQMQYDDDTVNKLTRINMFLCLFYVPLWLKASSGADAPILDLQLFCEMTEYRSIDEEVANTVLAKINNHRWYLTQEIVPFTLFSSSSMATTEIKKELAAKILATPVPESFRFGRPIFPDLSGNKHLADLIGAESHTLFGALNISNNWLKLPVEQWHTDADFCTAETFVRSVKVVNDAAERGVKLMTDFATCITRDPDQRAALLQAVERHRQLYPDSQKKALNI
jgi:hypothetical protein